MAQLTDEHINFIIKDLSYRGVVQDDVREEMLDPESGFPEELKARLRTELGVTAPQVAPPTNDPPNQTLQTKPK